MFSEVQFLFHRCHVKAFALQLQRSRRARAAQIPKRSFANDVHWTTLVSVPRSSSIRKAWSSAQTMCILSNSHSLSLSRNQTTGNAVRNQALLWAKCYQCSKLTNHRLWLIYAFTGTIPARPALASLVFSRTMAQLFQYCFARST